ncbi:uncharacterized protein LOC126742704 isoform X3 [Anthonomus grandis grandis]|uniref:uncharacterized protein LOC126742704 isoform X3 n=1 Tax=Anthonomus grandis grandis TaxID=2921223 RepID=UPI002166BFFD|nr:uncharacterized protein LOC126742704 isoform X3 [Anthonomus grandis grandis]
MTKDTDSLIFKGPVWKDVVNGGIGEEFWATAQKYGSKPFQIDGFSGKIQTFEEAKIRAIRVALDLKNLGVKPQDMIIVCGNPNFDAPIPALAALLLGAAVVEVLPDIELYDARYKISQIKPKAFFVTDSKLHVLQEILKTSEEQPEVYVMGNESEGCRWMNLIATTADPNENDFKPVKVDINDPAFVIFSSGTTSTSKPICLSHFSILALSAAENNVSQFDVSNFQPILLFVPYCHVSSIWILASSITNACPIIAAPKVSADKLLEIFANYEITSAYLSYGILTATCAVAESVYKKYDLSKVTKISTGGSYVHPKFIEKLKEIFPNAAIFRGYGSTEQCGTPFIFDKNADKDFINSYSESLGNKIFHNFEVKVVDPETGKLLGPNQKGELYTKSPYQMLGYYNKPCKEQFDEDGFLKTGDLVYYDDKGFFYFCDRLSAAFKHKGGFIFPSLVEERLSQHPSVKESSVFAVPHDEDRNRSFACVVLKPGKTATAEELSAFVVEKMGEFHELDGVKFFKKFPLTASEKIAVSELKKIVFAEKGIA